jgi:FimV-like protein
LQKLLIYILLLIIIGHVLTTNGIIPPLENIVVLLASYQTMLRPLLNDTSSLVISFLLLLPKLISSIPFNAINIWYVIGFLFIISYFFEKFRTINNSLSQLNRKIKSLFQTSVRPSSDNSLANQKVEELLEKAALIKNLLEDIKSASNGFLNSTSRSKAIHRNGANNEITDNSNVPDNIEKTTVSKTSKKVKNNIEPETTTEEIINDENISQIDLARALIESNETAKAMEILVRAVDTGDEEEKHEARLLYMQIKK